MRAIPFEQEKPEGSSADKLLDVLAELLADKLLARMGQQGREPTAYTFEEVAERYGVSKDSIKRWAAAGDFGPLLNVSERVHLITAEGLREFEELRKGEPGWGRRPAAQTRKKHRPNPGPI